jgi:hypothetical protein
MREFKTGLSLFDSQLPEVRKLLKYLFSYRHLTLIRLDLLLTQANFLIKLIPRGHYQQSCQTFLSMFVAPLDAYTPLHTL